jgi:hypothetical protein
LIDPRVEFKPVEGNALHTDTDFGERAAHLGVEAIAVHAEVARRVAEADQPRQQSGAGFEVLHLQTVPLVSESKGRQLGCRLALPGGFVAGRR